MPLVSEHAPRSISITLSPAQIDEVVRAASDSRAPSLVTVITDSLSVPLGGDRPPTRPGGTGHFEGPGGERNAAGTAHGYVPPESSDQRLSRSLVRGLSLLTRFGSDGEARGIVELAGDLDMSPSTAHRYALTLVELGLLERCPKSRKYRLAGTAS